MAIISIIATAAAVAAIPPTLPSLPPLSMEPDGRSYVFESYDGARKIGRHKISFHAAEGTLVVDVEVKMAGKVMMFGFDYDHRAREIWRGGALQRLQSKTTVNDRIDWVEASRVGNVVDVRSRFGSFSAPPSIIPTGWWNPGWSDDMTMLNSQKGTLEDVVIKSVEPVAGGGEEVLVRGKLNVDVTYDDKKCLAGLDFRLPVTGKQITYKLVARPQAANAPDLAKEPLIARCLTPGQGAS